MFLKAVLVGTLSIDEMKNKKYGHDLTALWAASRRRRTTRRWIGSIRPSRTFHAFDSIRYPDEIIAKGLLSGVGWAPEHATTFSGSIRPPPKYEFTINRVDELVIELLHRADLNPKFFVARFIGYSQPREPLTYHNPQVERPRW